MPLTTTSELVTDAVTHNVAVGAFNVITLEHIEAVISGAEEAARPVLLQISQNAVAFHGGTVAPLASAARAAAVRASVPVALHLDHVTSLELLKECTDFGFSSAMFDAGALPFSKNVARTMVAVEWTHANDIWIEAEIGYIGGKIGDMVAAHTAGARTDPDEAQRFATATGVDALAVAVGSSHAMTTRTATLDHELISRLAAVISLPLVLHGSSGVTDNDLRRAIAAGIRKVNVGTALSIAFTSALRETLDADHALVDPRRYLAPARDRVASKVTELLRLIGS